MTFRFAGARLLTGREKRMSLLVTWNIVEYLDSTIGVAGLEIGLLL